MSAGHEDLSCPHGVPKACCYQCWSSAGLGPLLLAKPQGATFRALDLTAALATAQKRIESLQRCVEQLIADGVDIDWADQERTDFGWTGRVFVREPQAGESDHFFNYDPTASGWGSLKRIEELEHHLSAVVEWIDADREWPLVMAPIRAALEKVKP